MTYRITQKMLEAKADYLNKITGSPAAAYRKVRVGAGEAFMATGDSSVKYRYKANIGNYHISYAYGGASLHRMSNEAGGVSTPIGHGHVPKRELLNQMEAYIRGLWDSDQFTGGD
jgi:hypothetical protein